MVLPFNHSPRGARRYFLTLKETQKMPSKIEICFTAQTNQNLSQSTKSLLQESEQSVSIVGDPL